MADEMDIFNGYGGLVGRLRMLRGWGASFVEAAWTTRGKRPSHAALHK